MSQPKVFVREATGLVRQVGLWDAVLLNIESNTFGMSLIYYELVLGQVPGGNAVLAAAIAALGCVPVAIAYASMSTAMPRSGGDYVFISRAIHPAIGVAASISISIWFLFWTGAYSNWAISMGAGTALQAAGLVLSNPTLLGMSAAALEMPYILLFGTILILGVCLIAARSTPLTFKLLDVMVFLGLLGVFLWTVLLGTTDKAAFINAFNSFATSQGVGDPDYYHTILRTATESGLDLNAPPTWLATINMIPFAAYIFPYLAAQSAVGGEVKDPGKNFFLGLLINLLISGVMVCAAMWALLSAAGYDFIMAIDYLFVTGQYGLSTPPFFTFFASIVTDNIALHALMAVGFICWVAAVVMINCIQVPRWVFAMSLDRILMEKFSAISRYGTPWVGVGFMAVGSVLMLFIFTFYASVLATVSAAFANIAATFMVACIAAAVFPFRKQTKAIYEAAPRLATIKVAGYPLMSLAGILGALFLGWVSYMYATNSIYAANSPTSLAVVGGIYVFGLLVYFIAKAYRARQGIDVTLAFQEIPPV
jgi:amino acid transporter